MKEIRVLTTDLKHENIVIYHLCCRIGHIHTIRIFVALVNSIRIILFMQ